VSERELQELRFKLFCDGRLTPRQIDVGALVIAGRSNGQIAEFYKIAKNTVEAHISGIYTRMGVRDRRELTSLFRRGKFPQQINLQSGKG
jgi:DNA-binding NarL/FixJ family response regulator